MSYIPFHHKYRPQTLKELVGQEAIATTLHNAITAERIAPAYLFTGLRGTGKTSTARILAKSLNCLQSKQPTPTPCCQCSSCKSIQSGSSLDVIEIDAATHTGVDCIRDLIERTQLAPIQGRYKVYIIDEVHQLSTAAFNALLKTLEEPPARVAFVLCTTELSKVLPTIVSRCQHFNFRPIADLVMAEHLEQIAKAESIDIEPEAIARAVSIANGGLRDAQSLLEQLSLYRERVSVKHVDELVGAVPEKDLIEVLEAIATDDYQAVIQQVRAILATGLNSTAVLQGTVNLYTQILFLKANPTESSNLASLAARWDVSSILKSQQHLQKYEVQLRQTAMPHLWLEIALLGLLPAAALEKPPLTLTAFVPAIALSPNATSDSPPNETLWQQVLKQQTPALAALLKQHGQLNAFDGQTAKIHLPSEPLRQRVEGALAQLESAFSLGAGNPIKVVLSC